jgi:hypothetical protein
VLRERRDRNFRHGVTAASSSSSRRNAPLEIERPPTASCLSTNHRLDLDSNHLTATNPGGNSSGHPIPGHIERRQSAPEQLQRRPVVPSIGRSVLPADPQPLAPQNAPWHRSSSPTPRKVGDTTFRYKDLEQNEIRLLRILPEITSIIKCEILHTSLDDSKKYIAISYAWGDLEDTRCIILDGHGFSVTESLWQALRKIRSRTSAVAVWVDAVCINQRNTAERNYQVQLMTSIYTKAHEMAIWIGPDAEDSGLAIRLLHKVVSAEESPSEIKDTILSPAWRPHFRALVALFNTETTGSVSR